MAVPIIAPLRDLFIARAGAARAGAIAAVLTMLCAVTAGGLVFAAGLVALSQRVGFPLAALVAAAGLVTLAALMRHVGQRQVARQTDLAAQAQARAEAEIALLARLSRPAAPVLPVLAFVLAYLVTRRS